MYYTFLLATNPVICVVKALITKLKTGLKNFKEVIDKINFDHDIFEDACYHL